MIDLKLQNVNMTYSQIQTSNTMKVKQLSFNTLKKDTFQPSFSSKYCAKTTLKDAKEYAIKNFKLKKFTVDNLDIANWINKSLQYNKNFSHGASTHLDEVIYIDFDKLNKPSSVLASMQTLSQRKIFFFSSNYNFFHRLYINKKYVNNIGNSIECSKRLLLNNKLLKYEQKKLKLNDNYITKNSNKYEYLMNKSLHKMSTEEKIELDAFLSTLEDYLNFKKSIVNRSIKNILMDKGYVAKLKNINLPNINMLNMQDKFKLLNYIEKKLGIKHDIKINSKYTIINHEIGHMLHAENDYNKFRDENNTFENFFQKNLYTASRVSQYATTNSREFIAETYAKMVDGFKMPKEIMSLYYKLGGPKFK